MKGVIAVLRYAVRHLAQTFTKAGALLLCIVLTQLISAVCALPGIAQTASAAATHWKFDFGSGETQLGWTGVSADTAYCPDTGCGFTPGTEVLNVDAPGEGVCSDAVQFTNAVPTGDHTFCADVPNGLYQVTVWVGAAYRTSIAIEGMYQIMNINADCTSHTLQVPVTDGQLNICACAGQIGPYTLAALEIERISAQTHTNPTVWVCGDSTVCNFYPLDTVQNLAGWAQLLPEYIDETEWQVMNMATSAQYAQGFLKGGQFTVIERNGQPGDIFVIAMGINDATYYNAEEYESAVTQMAKAAIDKKMRVILVKQQGCDSDIAKRPLNTERWFGSTLDRIGAALGIEVVDLFRLWQNFRLATGDTTPSPYYKSGDDIHLNRLGAAKLAAFIAEAIMPPMCQPKAETTAHTEITIPALIPGDLNGDGDISIGDAVLLARFITEDSAPDIANLRTDAADVNADGIVDALDLTALLRRLAGKTA